MKTYMYDIGLFSRENYQLSKKVATHKVLAHSCLSTNFRQKWPWDASFLNMNEIDS